MERENVKNLCLKFLVFLKKLETMIRIFLPHIAFSVFH